MTIPILDILLVLIYIDLLLKVEYISIGVI